MIGFPYFDLGVHSRLLRVVLIVVVWEHSDVVECKLLSNAILESLSLLQSQTVRFGNDRDHVDGLAEFLQDDNVNWLERMSRWVNEVQAAVYPCILNVALSLGSKLLPQVRRMLIFDISDNGIPAAVIIYKIAKAWGVHDVKLKTNAILLDDMCDRMDLSGVADVLSGREAALGIDKV